MRVVSNQVASVVLFTVLVLGATAVSAFVPRSSSCASDVFGGSKTTIRKAAAHCLFMSAVAESAIESAEGIVVR